MINREGNPIYSKPWRQYAIYRLEHWGLLYINNKGKITTFLTKSFFQYLQKLRTKFKRKKIYRLLICRSK